MKGSAESSTDGPKLGTETPTTTPLGLPEGLPLDTDNDGSDDDDFIRDKSFQCKQNTASIARIIKPIIP